MYLIGKYKKNDAMSDLICDNYTMLLVMNCFEIPLGFHDQTIEDVCQANDVNTATFLAVVNLLLNDEKDEPIQYDNLSAKSLINYLKNSHSYYLDFRLPAIRCKLVESLNCNDNKMSNLIIHYFDEYVLEVHKHMNYEDNNVFSYVESLLDGKIITDYNISIFNKNHDNIDIKLTELKNIIIKYYPVRISNELNSVLFDIFSCAKDLKSHGEVEDFLLVPFIEQLEKIAN